MRLAPGLVMESIEYAERGRPEPECKPDWRRLLLFGEPQAGFQKGFDIGFLVGYADGVTLRALLRQRLGRGVRDVRMN